MEPNSAPMPAPTRPETTKAVIIGPISRNTATAIMLGKSACPPKRASVLLVCMASTMPIAVPATPTSKIDLAPISCICRPVSSHSNGGLNKLVRKRPTNKK